jgi:hypothetical protein
MTNKRKPDGKAIPKNGEFLIGIFAAMSDDPVPLILLEQGFQKAPRGTNAIRGEPDTIDWSTTFRYPIGGESSTKDGVRMRREAIEEIVAPHVSTRKTQHAIRFKGEKRYVQSIENEEERQKVWCAIEVLQGIYHIQDCWQEHDIAGAIRIAYCVGRLDFALDTSERFNSPLFADVIQYHLAKDRGDAKKGKTKLTPEQLPIVEAALINNHRRKAWLKATTAELVDRHKLPNISTATVSDFIKKHGLLEKVAVTRTKR